MLFSKKIRVLLILFLFIDLCISFNQYYNTPIDGDLSSIVLPTEKFKSVLHDPSGVKAIVTNTDHPESNRFFSIAITTTLFRTVPFVLQKWVSPISSIYLTSAIIKLLTQLLIILLLSAYVTGGFNFSDNKFIFASVLFTLFFQVGGYSSTMGIIDSSISYTIGFAIPVALFLILFYPLAIKFIHGTVFKFTVTTAVMYFILAFSIPFFGNQIPFVFFTIMILSLIYGISKGKLGKNWLMNVADKKYKFILVTTAILCTYSFILSLYNSERNIQDFSLVHRFMKLPVGIVNILFGKPGLWILILLISANFIALKRIRSKKQTSSLQTLKWSGLFILIDVILQPFDGYYDFRVNIIRRDNFIPSILILIFLFVQSSMYFLESLSDNSRTKNIFSAYIAGVILLFTIADSPSLRIDNCERASLEMLGSSEDKIVRLSDRCTIANWHVITDSKDSEVNATVFQFWNITKERKYYFQQ